MNEMIDWPEPERGERGKEGRDDGKTNTPFSLARAQNHHDLRRREIARDQQALSSM